VACLDGTPWRLELARARCDLGAELRRLGRRAEGRVALEAAMDAAHACGAALLAERAAEELRASGARPRRRAVTGLDALTPSELRVARLAAAGRSNRDIAQELFVTPATVETHLTRTYRKLGIAGRDDLAASGV
jgi:DNA-binding NarL/FixJ family response regulator